MEHGDREEVPANGIVPPSRGPVQPSSCPPPFSVHPDVLLQALTAAPVFLYMAELAEDGAGHPVRAVWMNGDLGTFLGHRTPLPVDFGTWVSLLHPDDAAGAGEGLLAAFRIPVHWREYRLLGGDGGYRWIRDCTRLVATPGASPRILGCWIDVTAAKETELELTRERDFAEQIMFAMGQGLAVVDPEGRFLYANPAFASLLRTDVDRLIGQPCAALLPAQGLDATPVPADNGGREPYETVLRRSDGSEVEVLVSAVPRVVDGRAVGSILVVTDLTERLAAERDLRDSESRFRSVVEQAADGVLIHDVDGIILEVNDHACQLLDYERSELAGRPVQNLAGEDESAALVALWQDVLRHGPRTIEATFSRRAGDAIPVEVRVGPIERAGHLLLLSLVRDTSERRRLEIELRHAQKLESIGRLAAGVAHEINTPVQFIGDSVHFLQDAFQTLRARLDAYRAKLAEPSSDGPASQDTEQRGDLDDPELAYLDKHVPRAFQRTREGVERVARIVRAMRDFAHPGSGEQTWTDINHAIDAALVVSRNEYKYVADVITDYRLASSVRCHPDDLNQVFLNLIVNAAHAIAAARADTGGRGSIRIVTFNDGDHAVIRVSDTGVGIPDVVRDRIFDPFFTTKEVGRGTGQGLAIAHNIVVEKHFGALSFDSEVGKGTTFTVRLPIAGRESVLSGAPACIETPGDLPSEEVSS